MLALASNTQALTVSGTYNVSGTESHVGIFVGVSSTGTLNVSAGNTLNASGKFFINGNDGSGGYPNSAVNVNGGTLNYTNPSGEGFQVGWWYVSVRGTASPRALETLARWGGANDTNHYRSTVASLRSLPGLVATQFNHRSLTQASTSLRPSAQP